MQIIKSIIFSLCLILLFSNQVLCQDQSEEIKPFNVTIEYDKSGMPGSTGQLKILFEGHPVDIQEFNFLIKYDTSHYDKFNIEVGKSLLNKGWDKLVVHTIDDPDSAGIKIVQISGILDVSISRFNSGDDFAILKFRCGNDRTLEMKYVPIEFVWKGSNDNTIVTYPNNTKLYSNYKIIPSLKHKWAIYNAYSSLEYVAHETKTSPDNSKRVINFYNGGVQLEI